ncbi:MAG: EamA family transporter [Chitinophagaceae bacterium]|nr:MAG: EamA family transporter [Chitinophagaceae bacterium]
MNTQTKTAPSTLMVVLAFAVVYIVWGSTYFFIRVAIEDIPPFIMAALRFVIAAALMFGWCAYRKEKLFNPVHVKHAAISGLLMLFIGNGAVVWSEQFLPSSLVAILVSAGPIWFVMLDKANWSVNLKSKNIVFGLLIGFIGVIVLFSENVMHAISDSGSIWQVIATISLVIGSISWAGGSLYSKYKASGGSNAVNTAWQMITAGVVFLVFSVVSGETKTFDPNTVSTSAWLSLLYLVIMGSLIGYSSYVWLLSVRPATQVSTHAYVNPIVAVLLGVLFINEKLTAVQVSGLGIILASVLLINLNKYRKPRSKQEAPLAKLACEAS